MNNYKRRNMIRKNMVLSRLACYFISNNNKKITQEPRFNKDMKRVGRIQFTDQLAYAGTVLGVA